VGKYAAPAFKENPMYELNLAEQTVTLDRNGNKLVHVFRRAELDDCLAYQRAIQSVTRTRDFNVIESEFDATQANLELWETLIIGVGGYRSRQHGEIGSQEDWRKLVPDAHKITAAEKLYYLGTDWEYIVKDGYSDEITVALRARQNSQIVTKLAHRFREPLTSEQKEWNKFSALQKTEFVRGETVTHYQSRLREEIALYDAMILEIGGYTFNGVVIKAENEARAQMDPIHKSTALREAFRRIKDAAEEETSPFVPSG